MSFGTLQGYADARKPFGAAFPAFKQITTTLKASAGDYTSVSAWQADNGGATSKNLAGNNEAVTLECYKGDYTSVGGGTNFIDEDTAITGWTAAQESGQFITIRAPSTERHDGTPASGFHWKGNSLSMSVLDVAADNDLFAEFLDIESTHTVTYRLAVNLAGSNSKHRLIGCLIRSTGTGDNSLASISHRGILGAHSCIFIGSGPGNKTNAAYNANFSSPHVENCVFAGCDVGFANGSTTATYKPLIRNCVSWNCTNFETDAGSGYDSLTGYNAASNYTTDAPPDNVGSSNYTSDVVSGDFVSASATADPANDDYHLSSGSNLKSIGVDLSANFTLDIDGDTFVNWSIGADDGPATGGGGRKGVFGQRIFGGPFVGPFMLKRQDGPLAPAYAKRKAA